eukprot:gnl/TRDRNA2_/TRDRNA2_66029_c0_seq1.p2 gnl/TRDRNA2_/TRDRNA2_66029_c0~~gnl/TRDRNA2_/TRDRNA2_66029_c0_seq1.p2  ORF type:complete len:107 (+),score=16.77 gnl/TRDRNA2_/TRDRNA2_66029_c0_seq1:30-350(+)
MQFPPSQFPPSSPPLGFPHQPPARGGGSPMGLTDKIQGKTGLQFTMELLEGLEKRAVCERIKPVINKFVKEESPAKERGQCEDGLELIEQLRAALCGWLFPAMLKG